MTKDKRYNTVRLLFEAGSINSLAEIVDIIPKSVLAADLGLHYYQFLKKMQAPELFSIKELVTIASLIGVDTALIVTPIVTVAKKKIGKQHK
ncbi:MAG: hypothetical protein JO154_19695 [Chitinophaga sp.]|uniref:hypothetical protein n=1 Tax=Chitinophaga sp. TaxID=1869181 RepID=UPI0025BB53F1|nr:hypothetical protein [Chitinophaga sp.]MBV8254834.1 hypothetical protein [Chitinophaga sp.]